MQFYLTLPNNILVKFSDIPRAIFRFQIDTFVLVDDIAPMISSTSNICKVYWNKEYEKTSQETLEKLQELSPEKELIKGEGSLLFKIG